MKTKKDRLEFFSRRVQYWVDKLLIGPRTLVFVREMPTDAEEVHAKLRKRNCCDDEKARESEKQEEMIVSAMEQVLLGPGVYTAATMAMMKICGDGSATFAACSTGNGHYNQFTIFAGDSLLNAPKAVFKSVADACACHEVLHIFVWPTFSYLETLE